MDNIIEMARELGYELQNDDRFVRLQMARAASDSDAKLQELIGEFNLKRIAVGNEMEKQEGERDEMKISEMDEEIRKLYSDIMENSNMTAYQRAKEEMDRLVNGVMTIISMSAQGEDPDSAGESECGGQCSSCPGCH